MYTNIIFCPLNFILYQTKKFCYLRLQKSKLIVEGWDRKGGERARVRGDRKKREPMRKEEIRERQYFIINNL